MAFNIRRLQAARHALETAADNLKRYPYLTTKLNTQFIYLPESAQDMISVIVRAPMIDSDAGNVIAIFDQYTCRTCNKVGRLCQCAKEPVSP